MAVSFFLFFRCFSSVFFLPFIKTGHKVATNMVFVIHKILFDNDADDDDGGALH